MGPPCGGCSAGGASESVSSSFLSCPQDIAAPPRRGLCPSWPLCPLPRPPSALLRLTPSLGGPLLSEHPRPLPGLTVTDGVAQKPHPEVPATEACSHALPCSQQPLRAEASAQPVPSSPQLSPRACDTPEPAFSVPVPRPWLPAQTLLPARPHCPHPRPRAPAPCWEPCSRRAAFLKLTLLGRRGQ